MGVQLALTHQIEVFVSHLEESIVLGWLALLHVSLSVLQVNLPASKNRASLFLNNVELVNSLNLLHYIFALSHLQKEPHQ